MAHEMNPGVNRQHAKKIRLYHVVS